MIEPHARRPGPSQTAQTRRLCIHKRQACRLAVLRLVCAHNRVMALTGGGLTDGQALRCAYSQQLVGARSIRTLRGLGALGSGPPPLEGLSKLAFLAAGSYRALRAGVVGAEHALTLHLPACPGIEPHVDRLPHIQGEQRRSLWQLEQLPHIPLKAPPATKSCRYLSTQRRILIDFGLGLGNALPTGNCVNKR